MENSNLEKKFKTPIILVSIIIPVAVVLLFSIRLKDFGINVAPLSFLPPIYATINGITAALLVSAVVAIKKRNRAIHEKLMTSAIVCSVIFLLMYVAYHMTADPTKYGGEGVIKYVYYFLLLTHIALSVTIIPLVLFTYVKALVGQFDNHKKLAKITFPLWLYVAVTGVVVYLMIAPYYAN
jgi:putative membrane protein